MKGGGTNFSACMAVPFVLVLLGLAGCPSTASSSFSDRDREALLSLKEATHCGHSSSSCCANWTAAGDPCAWDSDHVGCSSSSGSVTSIDLSNCDLDGEYY